MRHVNRGHQGLALTGAALGGMICAMMLGGCSAPGDEEEERVGVGQQAESSCYELLGPCNEPCDPSIGECPEDPGTLQLGNTPDGPVAPLIPVGTWSDRTPTDATGKYLGGRLDGIWVNPSNEQNVVVASPGGGMWYTTNGGTSWTASTAGSPTQRVATHLELDVADPSRLYALTWNGLQVSTSSGVTWVSLVGGTTAPPLLPSQRAPARAVDFAPFTQINYGAGSPGDPHRAGVQRPRLVDERDDLHATVSIRRRHGRAEQLPHRHGRRYGEQAGLHRHVPRRDRG